MAKLHNKADKGTVEGAVPDVPYKGPVYLDNIRGRLFQNSQRRISRSKIVHGDFNPQLPDGTETF